MNNTYLKVVRHSDDGTQTLGQMFVIKDGGDAFYCDTLELPWKDNEHAVSCIPKGEYQCRKVGPSPHIPYPHIWITDVPDREGVKIHVANFVSQLRGCIAVGTGLADLNHDGRMDVVASKQTLTRLMTFLPEEFKLEIV